jgi:CRP-like cAMP-binding protein
VAVTECELVPIDQRRFLFLVQQTPHFALHIMSLMALRLRRMDTQFAQKS